MNHAAAVWMIRLPPVADMTQNQPLGFMYLAAALRRAGFWNLRILDLAPQRISLSRVLGELRRQPPEVVFLTADTVDVPGLQLFTRHVRQVAPHARLVVGGPHPSADPTACLDQLPDCDVAVLHDGEETAQELLAALEPGSVDGLDRIAGIAYRESPDSVQVTAPRPTPAGLDDDLWPAYDLIDVPAYFRHPRMGLLFKALEYMSLFTSRGCPYGCTYCHNVFGNQYRAHSAERVIEEMSYLVRKHGIREFQILDDLFNYDSERTLQICESIRALGLRVHFGFPNGLRCDRLTPEEITALARAGCWRINVAVETASEHLQEQIHKHNDLDHIARTIHLSAAEGMLTHGFFMLGFPAETRAQLEETVAWAERSELHLANFFRVIPMPGSPIRGEARELGIDVDNAFEAFEGNGSNFNLSEVDTGELEQVHREATRRFYRDPKRLARILTVLPRHPALLGLYAKEFVTRLVIGTTYPHLAQKLSGDSGVQPGLEWLKTGDAYGR